MAERQEHPPRPGRGDPAAGIVGDHGVAGGNAERRDVAGKLLGIRIHMRPRIVAIGDGVDVEKHRAGNVRGEIIIGRQRQHAGHLVGRVDDFDFWVVEMGGEPVGRDQRIVGG